MHLEHLSPCSCSTCERAGLARCRLESRVLLKSPHHTQTPGDSKDGQLWVVEHYCPIQCVT